MRAWGGFFVACAAALAATWFLAPVYWGPKEAGVVVACAAMCLGAALVALVPVAWASERAPSWLNQAGLAAMGLRMLLTLGGCAIYFALAAPPMPFFLTCIAAWYLALLAVETGYIVVFTRKYWGARPGRNEGQSGG